MHPKLFRGWIVVAAAFAVTFLGFGSAYTFSTFLEPLQQEFAASRGSASLVFSLAGCLYFGLGMVSGPLADRVGARPLVAIGMLLIGLGMVAASTAHHLVTVYLGYGLGVGLGIGCAYVPALGAVQRWFVRHRGLASGLAVSGTGMGTLAMPPLALALIHAWGWRDAYLVLGIGVAMLGLAVACLVEDDPRRHGFGPDGTPMASAAIAQSVAGLSIRDAIGSRPFLVLYASCAACAFGLFVPFVHLVPYAVDHGVDAARAVLLVGVIGVGSTGGRFALGSIADRIGRDAALRLMFGGMAAAQLVWACADGFWLLAVFAFCYGAFYGGFVAVLPALVMDRFGGRHVSGMIGVLYTSVALGTLIGPTAVGYARDAVGDYLLPICASALSSACAAVIMTLGDRARASSLKPTYA